MRKLAVVIDSIANLPPEMVRQYGLRILPINIHFNDRTYRDGIDITAAEAYRMLAEKPDQFYSSPASIGDYLAVFQEAAAEAESILCITLSSKLSGLNNIAQLALKQAREEGFTVPVEILDSRNAAVSEGLIVTAAARAAAEGKALAETAQAAESVSERVKLVGFMDTIRYVYRTGRIPKFTARFGSFLKIKPVFNIMDGGVKIAGITKNRETGVQRILRQMRKDIQGRPVHVAVAHAAVPEDGEKLKETIRNEFNCVELWMSDFSPVMGYATGEGVLVAGYYV